MKLLDSLKHDLAFDLGHKKLFTIENDIFNNLHIPLLMQIEFQFLRHIKDELGR